MVGEPDPRLQPLQFVGVHRREVDRVPHDTVAQEVPDCRRRVEPDELLGFLGGRGDVRRGDDLRHFGKRPIRRRLLLEDIQRRRRDDAPARGAACSAASSISSPRAVLMMRTPGFIRAKRSAFRRWCVSVVDGR